MKRNVLSSLFLLFFSITAFAFPEQMSVTASSLNVRSGPSADYEIVFKLTQDEKIEVLGATANKDWAYFQNPDYPGQTLWVAMPYLSKVTPIVSSTPVNKPLNTKNTERKNPVVEGIKTSGEDASVINAVLDKWLFGIFVICLIFLLIGVVFRSKAGQKMSEVEEFEKFLEGTSLDVLLAEFKTKKEEIENKITDGSSHYEKLKLELNELERKVEALDFGLRKPVFGFDDPEELKEQIHEIRQEQYEIIKSGLGTEAYTTWTYFDSKAKGQQMVDAYCALLLNAYNAEFEAIRRSMRVSTRGVAEGKLEKLGEQLARLGEAVACKISEDYSNLKSIELDIWYENLVAKEEAKQQRKKHQKLLREQAKNKSLSELDEIDKDTEYRQSDLIKARKIASQLVGMDATEMAQKIEKLEAELAMLEEKRIAAMSQAQKTRAGFIYVISNIGSFGEGICKIGMTRRLEPMERVTELGDASVPFRFDVHALAFTTDAPTVESALHQKFNDRRVNKENNRKEFFSVSPQEAEAAFEELGLQSEWYFEVEAREYRESLLLRESMNESKRIAETQSLIDRYPEAI